MLFDLSIFHCFSELHGTNIATDSRWRCWSGTRSRSGKDLFGMDCQSPNSSLPKRGLALRGPSRLLEKVKQLNQIRIIRWGVPFSQKVA
jgi:hypothetical protein